MTTPGLRFSIDLPEEWLYAAGEDLDRLPARLREAFSGATGPQAEFATSVARELQEVVARGRGAGLDALATYLEVIAPPVPFEVTQLPLDADEIPQTILTATMLLASVPSPDGSAATVSGLLAELRGQEPRGEVRLLREPAAVALPAGDAAHVRELVAYRTPVMKQPVDSLQVTYHLPVDDGQALVLLTFRTPCLGLSDAFSEMFEVIASSLVVTVEPIDEPTNAGRAVEPE